MVTSAVDFFDMVSQTDWQQSLERTLVHWIGVHPRHVVLDVGCGAGRFVILLAQRAEFVTGVDASPEMVERTMQNLHEFGVNNGEAVVGRAQDLPFSGDKFDTVTCLNLLFMFEDPTPIVKELVRVCKPGGHVVLMEPAGALNPWSAQTYCAQNEFYDFERDSLLSFATACARYQRTHSGAMEEAISATGITHVEKSDTMDGLVHLYRLEKPLLTENL